MAIKQVKKYYQEIQKLYFEMADDLKDMQKEFERGEVTEEQLNKLMTPVNNIRTNYTILSYIMYLLYQPNREQKKNKYTKENKELNQFFNSSKLDENSVIEESKNSLKLFKENINKFKEELTHND